MLELRLYACAAVLAVLSATGAGAAPASLGPSFPVSNCNTCAQRMPTAAVLPNGNFLVTWEGSNAQDPKAAFGRVFKSPQAASGLPFLLTPTLAPDQYDAEVAADATGYVAVWTSITVANSDVYAQRFNTSGGKVGNPILVNVDGAPPALRGLDFKPAVTKLPGGGFAVVWSRSFPATITTPGTAPVVLSRVFGATGAPLGPPVAISTGLVNGDRPSVCADTTGRFVAVWTTDDELRPFEASKIGVKARRMSKTNAPLGPEMVIAPPKATDSTAAVACGKGNVFAVAWQSDQAPALRRADVLVARYQMTGAKVGATILANKITDRDQKNPSISYDPAGNFVVVWESTLESGGGAILARRFSTNGAPTGDDFTITSVPTITDQKPVNPEVVHQGTAGNFLVLWQKASLLYGQRFKP